MQSHSKNFKRTTLIVSKCVFVFPFFYGDGKELRKKKKFEKRDHQVVGSCWPQSSTLDFVCVHQIQSWLMNRTKKLREKNEIVLQGTSHGKHSTRLGLMIFSFPSK